MFDKIIDIKYSNVQRADEVVPSGGHCLWVRTAILSGGVAFFPSTGTAESPSLLRKLVRRETFTGSKPSASPDR
jgi:hypothetical protein